MLPPTMRGPLPKPKFTGGKSVGKPRPVAAANQARKKARALGEVSGGMEIRQEPARQVQGSPMAGESHVTTKSHTLRDPAALSASQSRPGTTVVRIGGGDHQREWGGTDDRLARSAIPARSEG